MKIFKYQAEPYSEIDPRAVVRLPAHARILSAHGQHDKICCWAEVDPYANDDTKLVWVFPTGDAAPRGWRFVGTVLIYGGDFAFHLYEEPPHAH